MAKKIIPEYVKLTADGADVTLSREYRFQNSITDVISIRESTVDDQEMHLDGNGSELKQEKNFLAHLTGLTPTDVGTLRTRDYLRLQRAQGLFID